MADQETERLRVELRNLHTENKLVGVSFAVALFVTYILLPTAFASTHLGTSVLLRLAVLCCFVGGSLLTVLLTSIFRVRTYRGMRHSETIRMQEQFLHSQGKDKAR